MSVFRRIAVGEYIFESAQDGIVAKAGGGQATAFQLTAEMNRISTVATAGDSVMLPPAQPGLGLLVVNHGTKSMQVFGQPGDTINDVATGTGVPQMQNSAVFYFCFTAGAWYTEGLASGFAGGLATFSVAEGLTAFAGGGQANGTLLTAMINRFTTVATGGDSSKLPAALVGMEIVVINAGAASMNVFPATGEQINAAGANAAFAVAATKTCTFFCTLAGQWHTQLTA
jgi:hypothetical protein